MTESCLPMYGFLRPAALTTTATLNSRLGCGLCMNQHGTMLYRSRFWKRLSHRRFFWRPPQYQFARRYSDALSVMSTVLLWPLRIVTCPAGPSLKHPVTIRAAGGTCTWVISKEPMHPTQWQAKSSQCSRSYVIECGAVYIVAAHPKNTPKTTTQW